jgi:hypothetical protein
MTKINFDLTIEIPDELTCLFGDYRDYPDGDPRFATVFNLLIAENLPQEDKIATGKYLVDQIYAAHLKV